MDRINGFLDQHKIAIGLIVVGLVLLIGGIFSANLTPNIGKSAKFSQKSLVKEVTPATIKIDIAGAIVNPGVYSLATGARLEDAIKIAGGFGNSDPDFIAKTINLSQKLSDGQKIYIPSQEEVVKTGYQSNLVGINSADSSKLEELPGVGKVTALKIIEGRPFSELTELVTKEIISKAKFDKIIKLIDLH